MGIPGLNFSLSATQQEFLIDHVDCIRPIVHNHTEDATRNALLRMKLIDYSQPLVITAHPKGTVLTNEGRETMCRVLGWMADQLHRSRRVHQITTPRPPRAYGVVKSWWE